MYSQDILYPVEAVVLAGGYVVHQVTAVDSLKTGDRVQLHLDQVHTKQPSICLGLSTDFISLLRRSSLTEQHNLVSDVFTVGLHDIGKKKNDMKKYRNFHQMT